MNYHTFGGYEAIDDLAVLVKRLGELGQPSDWVQSTEKKLLESKQYLKSEYKLHVKQKSIVADHCIQYALSDPRNAALAERCTDHEHYNLCDHCANQKRTVDEIIELIESTNFPKASEKGEAVYIADKAKEALMEYKKHQFRAVHQIKAKIDVVNNLQIYQCSLQMDFAMKWVVQSGRESSADWYGKRGVVWHITHVICKPPSGNNYIWRTYIHILEDSEPQDSGAVIAFLKDVLLRVKEELPHITTAFVYSDNAGAYHGSKTIGSVPHVSQQTNIQIQRWDFAEVQDGKGHCDSMAAVAKRRARIYMVGNKKCSNAEDFLECITSGGGTEGVTALYGSLEGEREHPSPVIAKITEFSNFLFGENGITAWRAYQIGSGITIKKMCMMESIHV